MLRKFFFGVLLVAGAFQPGTAAFAEEVSDPLETFNRAMFWFNNQLDTYLLEPVARAYDFIVPDPVQTSVGNFFENLTYPVYLVSDVVQGKFDQAGTHTGRFVVNTTVGVAGLFDVAEDWGLKRHREDFGVALAYHGVPSGPYLVLPILGPSNFRDGFGRIVDGFLDPVFYVPSTNWSEGAKLSVTLGLKGLQLIDTRAGLLEAVDTAKESSLDMYLFVQSAYYQHRRGVLYDGDPPDEEDDYPVDVSGSSSENTQAGATAPQGPSNVTTTTGFPSSTPSWLPQFVE